MDPASVLTFIGFGAQTVGVIQQLLSFLSAVRDAPSSVQDFIHELEILEDVIFASTQDEEKLEHTSERARKAYQKALGAVDQQCRALLGLLEAALPKKGAGRRKRIWNAVNFVSKEEKFAKLLEGLERAKSSLCMAQSCISTYGRPCKQLTIAY